MQITINMTDADFQRLSTTSTSWGADWQMQASRFEHMSKRYDEEPSWLWKHAYWLGDSWTTVLLARSFLEAQGAAYEVLWDMNPNPAPEYVILTDYTTSVRKAGESHEGKD